MIKTIYDKEVLKNKIKEYKEESIYKFELIQNILDGSQSAECWEFITKTTKTKIEFNNKGLFLRKWRKVGNNYEITKKEIYLR